MKDELFLTTKTDAIEKEYIIEALLIPNNLSFDTTKDTTLKAKIGTIVSKKNFNIRVIGAFIHN